MYTREAKQEVSNHLWDFLMMSPWVAEPEYELRYINADFFRDEMLVGFSARHGEKEVCGRMQQRRDIFNNRLAAYGYVYVHGFRGTGKTTFVSQIMGRRARHHFADGLQVLDCEETHYSGEAGEEVPPEELVQELFREWLVRRLTNSDDLAAGGILGMLESWNDSNLLGKTKVARGKQLARLQGAVASWISDSRLKIPVLADSKRGHAVLRDEHVENGIANLSEKDLAILLVLVGFAWVLSQGESLTIVIDNLDWFGPAIVANVVVGTVIPTFRKLKNRLAQTEGGRPGTAGRSGVAPATLKIVLVARTRVLDQAKKRQGAGDAYHDSLSQWGCSPNRGPAAQETIAD